MQFYLDLMEIRPRQAQFKQNELVLGGACVVVDVPDNKGYWWYDKREGKTDNPVLTLEGMVWIRNNADEMLNNEYEEIVEIEEKIEFQSASVVEKSKILAAMEGRSKTLRQKREVIDQAYKEMEKELNARKKEVDIRDKDTRLNETQIKRELSSLLKKQEKIILMK